MKDDKAKKDEYQKALAAYGEAIKDFRKGKFDKSAETLRTFVEKFPAERELVDRAKIYLDVCLKKINEPKNPQDALALNTAADHFHYAVQKMNLGENAEAEQLLEKAAKLDPENGRIHFLLADLYCLSDRSEACLESLRKAIQADKSFRTLAQNEIDFELLWDDKRFRLLIRS